MQQVRKCDNPEPANGGHGCKGLVRNVKACNVHRCPSKIARKRLFIYAVLRFYNHVSLKPYVDFRVLAGLLCEKLVFAYGNNSCVKNFYFDHELQFITIFPLSQCRKIS